MPIDFMPIDFMCPCGQKLRVKDEFAGRKVRCPKCSQPVTAAASAPEPLVAVLVPDEEPDFKFADYKPTAPVASSNTEEDWLEALNRVPPSTPDPATQRQSLFASNPYQSPGNPAAKKPVAKSKPRPVARREEGFGSTNSGVLGGVAMIVIAIIWFAAGYAAGVIFFYPPILAILGFIAIVKGLFND